jgi:hypothetical protein
MLLTNNVQMWYSLKHRSKPTMDMPAFNFDVDIPSLREAVGLTHTEARVLLMLLQEEIATHEQLVVVNSRVRQLMYSLRNKLKAQGITIVNDRDIGYSIPLKYKLRIKNLIEGELLEEIKRSNDISEQMEEQR